MILSPGKRGERCQRATDTDELGNNPDESQTVSIKRVMTHCALFYLSSILLAVEITTQLTEYSCWSSISSKNKLWKRRFYCWVKSLRVQGALCIRFLCFTIIPNPTAPPSFFPRRISLRLRSVQHVFQNFRLFFVSLPPSVRFIRLPTKKFNQKAMRQTFSFACIV